MILGSQLKLAWPALVQGKMGVAIGLKGLTSNSLKPELELEYS